MYWVQLRWILHSAELQSAKIHAQDLREKFGTESIDIATDACPNHELSGIQLLDSHNSKQVFFDRHPCPHIMLIIGGYRFKS